MRGADIQQGGLFRYGSMESRIPAQDPLRAVRTLLDEALASKSRCFDQVSVEGGHGSVPPDRLLRALVLQVLRSIRGERLIEAKVARKPLRRLVRQARRSGLPSNEHLTGYGALIESWAA